MPDFTIKKDTTLTPLDVRLLAVNGARIDLTSVTVQFRMRPKGGTVNVIDTAATIIDARQGWVRYQWLLTDTAVIGDYEAEFEITYPDTNNRIFPNPGFISIRIADSL